MIKYLKNLSSTSTVELEDRTIISKDLQVTSNTISTSTTTGALTVASGAGITGNVNAGAVYTNNYFYANGTAFISGITFTGGNVANAVSIQSTTESTSTTTGALTVAGGLGVTKTLTVGGAANLFGNLTVQQTSEVLNTKTGATGAVVHDFTTGAIFYHTAIAANFTVNLTNVPTTNNRALTLTLILAQGTTANYAAGLQIDGAAQSFTWTNNTAPTPTANALEIQSFTFFRVSDAWRVVSQYGTFG